MGGGEEGWRGGRRRREEGGEEGREDERPEQRPGAGHRAAPQGDTPEGGGGRDEKEPRRLQSRGRRGQGTLKKGAQGPSPSRARAGSTPQTLGAVAPRACGVASP